MIEIMAACKEKMWGFKQLFVSNIMVSLGGGGFPEGSILDL